ncbi:MAG: DNA polymerase I [Candidatus Sulfobium sp.]|jgi:DNA polymerase-1
MNLFLVDGNSYVYRAFYAIRGLTNSEGFPTNAIYGFTNMLLKIIREKRPDGVAVFFDRPEPTARHRMYKEYKAHRPEAPADLVRQLPYIRQVVAAFGIPVFEIPGYEADDLIGTVARKAGGAGDSVFIVTADKDMLQLVNERVKIYDPMKDRVLDENYVREKFGVGPERVTEFIALMGDASDNIPGIRGVGEKTAKELLSLFGSIDELLGHPERIPKERLKKMVSENSEIVRLSRELATIDTSVPVEFREKDFLLGEPDWVSLLPLFRRFEFLSLMKLIPSAAYSSREYETVTSAGRLEEIVAGLEDELAFDTETTGRNPLTESLVGISLCMKNEKAFYIPVGHSTVPPAGQPDKRSVLGILKPVLENEELSKIGHNLKFDITVLEREGIDLAGKLFDTMIAAYLLNPNKSNHSLGEVSFEYLSKRKKSFAEILKKRATFAEVAVEEAAPYAAEDAALSYELKSVLFEKIGAAGLEGVYFDIEMPLIRVLSDMEKTGIRIEASLLKKMSREIEVEIESVQRRIFFIAGEEFNINSPKQLGKVLFHSLGLNPSKRTKTGYSTSVDVLEELSRIHELPREVLHFRSLTKLKTTYLDVLPTLINPRTGRVHTSFNQTVTATGRLSSSDPNLQNIPVRGEWGQRIREAFTSGEGDLLLSSDYSQVELRILAHTSGDRGLIDAFAEGLDIHNRTASELYGVSLEEVTPEMRRTAKTVNFGVLYGISPFGLSEALGIGREDAKQYIDRYFKRHPGVREYIERTIAEATQKGHVTTLLGRRRPVPELHSANRNTRQQGQRLAVNSPIQGTAADIIKIAMIKIAERFRRETLRAKMILQVHDELLVELPEEELDAVTGIVTGEMEGAFKLAVPLKVEIGHGKNWAEAH